MATAYAYRRVSTIDQAQHGFSLEAQKDAANAYYQMLIHTQEKYKDLAWGGFYSDGGQSAWKIPFAERQAGRKLVEKLQEGDQIIFCKLDRAFRSLKDSVNQIGEWMEKGIGIHFIDQQLNMDSANGRLAANILTSVSQWESDIKSERCKEAALIRKNKNKPVNGTIPTGSRIVGRGGNKRFVLDPENRIIYRYIKHCRTYKSMSFQEISDKLESALAVREGRKYIPHNHCTLDRPWKKGKIQTAWGVMGFLLPDCKPSSRIKIWNEGMESWKNANT